MPCSETWVLYQTSRSIFYSILQPLYLTCIQEPKTTASVVQLNHRENDVNAQTCGDVGVGDLPPLCHTHHSHHSLLPRPLANRRRCSCHFDNATSRDRCACGDDGIGDLPPAVRTRHRHHPLLTRLPKMFLCIF